MSLRALIIPVTALVLVLTGPRDVSTPSAPASNALGSGPVIALVHGLGGGPTDWLSTARILARRHRVIILDLPGHGASAMPEPFSLARATRSLDLALARASREPVVLVGHSLGGLVAAAEACDHPGRVRALVLIETALRPQLEGPDRAAALDALERDYAGTLRRTYADFARDSAQGVLLYGQVAAMDPAVVKAWVRLAFTADLSTRVTRLSCPLLVVLAPRSWPAGEPWVETAAALGYGAAPQVRPARIPDCGHFVMLDRPAELAALIGHFADSPAAGPVVLALPGR